MGKNRKWQLICILAVTILTVYNILPTLFYYSKPLHSPISQEQGKKIALEIQERVNSLENESLTWVQSYCKLIEVHPTKMTLDPKDSEWISVHFTKVEEANRFRSLLPKAGTLIPFAPAKLAIGNVEGNTVLIQRQIPFHLKSEDNVFTYVSKKDEAYKDIIVEQADESNVKIRKATPIQQNQLPFGEKNLSGYILLDLKKLATLEIEHLVSNLKTKWNPKHPDLQNISIVAEKDFEHLPMNEKSLCLIVSSPLHSNVSGENDSIYLVAKGFERIAKTYSESTDNPLSEALRADVYTLHRLLYQMGFTRMSDKPSSHGGDFQFEKSGFAASILSATREDFRILGNKHYAVLDISNYEQRTRALNKIETAMHEELIRWNDSYLAAQVNPHSQERFSTPKPTRSILWNNLLLSLRKMIRGDHQKIIRWGLDLSGGKSVEIELRDTQNRVVQGDNEIQQGIKELRNRVNKMGLSEVSIRQVGQHIVLDFPGSQNLTASELIKASSMLFHVVNEKFSPFNPTFGEISNRFLQSVWDEALFLGKTDSTSVNEIAKKHLASMSDETKILRENGLVFGGTDHTSSLDDTLSKIAVHRGSSPADWHGLSHPLLITFNNYAITGSDLENIHSSYDPSHGNFLAFNVASNSKEGNPQNNIHAWTSKYSKENILGTPNEMYSRGKGWRMAVVLNDTVISAPSLEATIRDSASISGSFSLNEIQHLCTDLKMGSMTFTPHILSEKNVSPELGSTDRAKGITATFVALVLVIVCMIGYYRFAGFIASVAVIFNLLILWAVLQNLGATLTLAGIAGIILTVGMSIDANVLVFERIKEEFAMTARIQSAIQAGYNKAFSAIIDSNITTIIASLILLNFDAGPIKNFATNLIIGIVSSMFTALFMTRFYFTGWAQNPKNQALKMANWMRKTAFDFLKRTKIAYASALVIIVLGMSVLFVKSSAILGLDFSGGYSLYLEVEPRGDREYGAEVKEALVKAGASHSDFMIQEMNPPNQLRIFLGQTMEQKGKPFAELPIEVEGTLYKKNPRICWVVDALNSSGITISKQELSKLHSNWTAVSGQMSDAMRNSALFGFLLAFLGIFVYLCFRFEYKFAAAALVCLIHDVFITLAVMGILFFMAVPVQLDLITIAALMTAVGYSLNDKIIIFDRIREEIYLKPNRNLRDTVNYALNFTLSRTMITSGTTLLVLLALLVLGGSSIFGFALVMTIGVVFGTLSSWFIAAPLMLHFETREEKKLVIQKSL